MIELKPCPFCGGVAAIDEDRKTVYCTDCPAEMNQTVGYSLKQNIECWNDREVTE